MTGLRQRLGAVPVAVLIVMFFIYPLARLLVMPILHPHGLDGDWRALRDSLVLSLVTALIAAPIGAALALFITTAEGIVVRAAVVTLWALFLAPGYILTTGWMIVFANGALRQTIVGHAFFGVGGLLLLYVLKAVPFSAVIARASLVGLDAGPVEAAAIHAVPPVARLRVIARLLLPAAAVGFAIAVIETMQEFGIPATLGIASRIPLLTYVIYQRLAETPTDFRGAAELCWGLIGVAALFGVASLALRREGAAVRHGRARVAPRRRPGRVAAVAFGALAAILAVAGVVVPVIALAVVATRSFATPMPHAGAVVRSLGFGMVGAALALGVAFMVLRLYATGARRLAAMLDTGLIANMAVPGLVLAAGYIVAFNNDVLPLYGTRLLLLIGYAAGVVPLALRLVQGAVDDLDKNLVAAACLHGVPRLARMVDIEGMLLIQPVIYGYLLVASRIMFELPVSELLYPPDATPLGVAIVALDQKSMYAASAALGLLGLAAMAGFALALALGGRLLVMPKRAVSP